MQLHIGDGVGEPFEGLYPPGITLSPDRHNLAYAIIRKGYNFHCINLACRPQAFEYFGIGLHVPEGLFGPTFWKNVTLESVLNIAMMGQGSVSVIQHGTPGRWVFYGSTVFSPDGQHYAYVGYNGGSKIYLDGIETASVPTPARVDYLQFSANSDVLVYRTSNANATSAVPIPGTKQFLGSSVGDASAATLTITTKQPYALVYLNDQFVGVAPQTIRVPSGIKRVELQRRGYKSQNVSLSAKPGSTQSVELDLEPLPMRKAIESVLDPSRNSNILLPTDAKSDDIIKGRILVKAPFDEEILGALRLRGDNAVLFGETGIYIHNERSSQSNDPHRFFVPYTVFADSVEPVEHPSFEIAVTGDAVALISSLGLGFMDRGRALMGELRKALSTRKEDSNCLGCQAH